MTLKTLPILLAGTWLAAFCCHPCLAATINETGASPLTMEEAVSFSLQDNFDIALARIRNEISLAEESRVLGRYDTTLSLEGGFSDDETDPLSSVFPKRTIRANTDVSLSKTFSSGSLATIRLLNERISTPSSLLASSVNPYFESNVQIEISQPLAQNAFGFITRREVKLVRLDISRASLATQSRIEAILADTKRAYFALQHAWRFHQAKSDALDQAKEFLRINEEQLKTGLVEETDFLAAKADFLIKTNDLKAAQDALLNASNDLKLTMNYYPTAILVPVESPFSIQDSDSLEHHLALAIEHRRDFQSQKLALEAAGVVVEITRQRRWPQVDLQASFLSNGISKTYENALGQAVSKGEDAYFIGGKIHLPLENRQASASFSQAKLRQSEALAQLKKLEREIELEVDQSWRKIRLEQDRYIQNKVVTELQEKKMHEEEKKFKIGRSSSDLIIRYQNDWINAKIEESRSLTDYLKAVVDLQQAENVLLLQVQSTPPRFSQTKET